VERILIGTESEVLVGRGLPAALLDERAGRRQTVVLTQPGAQNVAGRVAAAIEAEGLRCALRVLPDRDDAKTLEVVAGLYEWLADLEVARDDTVVGVGGGSVTDVAGFVAATWLRGVESVLLPTTVLGAVDAAIGGKTGVNLRGKNLVGAFWHPSRVVIDIDVLDALPPELKREGFSEALKAGLIGDPELVDLFDRHGAAVPMDQVVLRAVTVKASVVAGDFREAGRRAILNYGHTIGHAVEMAGGISHGEAVAVGMVAAGAISEQSEGFTGAARQRELIERLGLPTEAPGLDRAGITDLLALDKKRRDGVLRMVLLRSIGEPVVKAVDGRDVEVGLAAVGIG
jgi:3-dehydroquinate synthase